MVSLVALGVGCKAADGTPSDGDPGTLSPDASTFVLGYNFGDATAQSDLIGGHTLVAQTQAGNASLAIAPIGGLSGVNAWTTAYAAGSLLPPTGGAMADLLNHHFSVTQGGIAIKQKLPNGSYQVYTYHMENNGSYSRSFNVAVQGKVVTSQPVSLAHLQWVKLGPFSANVNNGVLEVDLQHVTGDASIMGMEIYQVPNPSSSTFVVGYNFGDGTAASDVVGGHTLAAQTSAGSASLAIAGIGGLSGVNAWTTAYAAGSFLPAADAPTADVLNHHFSVTQGGISIKQGLTNGTYQVYTYHMENNSSQSRSFNIAVQGSVVTSQPISLSHLQWAKMGPYAAQVTNGTLEVDLQQVAGDASIMGMEVYSTTGGQVAPLPAGRAAPSGFVPTGYQLVFSDEFNGSVLDKGRWMTQYPCGCLKLNDEIEHYTNDGSNLFLGGGNITIEGRSDLSSGVFTAQPSFKYGYFELRAKMAVSKGAWPAYWLTSDSRWPPEWDIFEVVSDPTKVFQTPHPVNGDSATCDGSNPAAYNIDVNTAFHVYGFQWTPTEITWYIDGQKTRHCAINAASASDFMWLQHNMAIGGGWPGNPDNTTQWPLELIIDYSRVYQDARGQMNMHAASGPLVDPASPL
jgi:hypothetical protein